MGVRYLASSCLMMLSSPFLKDVTNKVQAWGI
uniref:Uncharacterized protein n=1 Tax=Arundo donax TaxID=35708 RepID=A0A0A9CF31_ARUDO